MSDWPHSPVHRLAEAGVYMVTCGTYLKRHHFQSSERLRSLCETLQRLAAKYGWNLQAWAVFSNHYHWVGLSPDGPATLRTLVSDLHTETSSAMNEADHTPEAGMVPVLGDTSHLSTLVPCAAELRPPQRGASPAGSRTIALPLVLGGMVRAEGERVLLQDGDEIRDRAAEGTGRV